MREMQTIRAHGLDFFKMHRRRIGLVSSLCACVLFAGQAHANPWYARVDAGTSVATDFDLDTAGFLIDQPQTDGNWAASVAIGREIGDWRIEAEASFHRTELKPSLGLDQGGSLEVPSAMVNVFRDFGSGGVRPYLGAGIGVARPRLRASNTAPLVPVGIDSRSTALAYQLMAGVAIPVSDRVKLDLGFRRFSSTSFDGSGAAPPVISFPFQAQVSENSLTAGVRLNF